MHVALLFPPATDPRSPHLALPSLAAALRRGGIRVTMRDLDLEGLLAQIDPANVAEAARACRRRLARTDDAGDRLRLQDALRHADAVIASIGETPARLRTPASFYQPHVFHTARETIVRALSIVSAAAGPVHYSTGPVAYDVAGVDPARLADLAAVTADPHANLHERFYAERLLPDLERDPPDVVGVSILNYQQIIPGLTLARTLKEHGHFVVIGGTVYSKFVPELLRRPEFVRLFCDGVVAYEGETALTALVDELAGARDFRRVPNLLFLDARGRPAMGPTHAEDVNALPTPDFDGLPLDGYLAPRPVLPILTGKGCYFNRCKFCDIPFINTVAGKAYRVRRPDLIAADVAALQRRYGVRHFEITDEALAPRLLLHLADALADHPDVEARFVGYARLEPGFTAAVCRRLYDMGMRKLFFGLESGSQATLDHMDKGIRLEVAREVLRNCAEAGIGFHLFSIVGFPEETEARARETLAFFLDNGDVLDHPRNSFDIHPFTLDLRTDYADRAADFGLVLDRDELAARDFLLSVERWQNPRGIDQETTTRLIAEFHERLRLAYPAFRQFPAHLWPSFEEYAVLYADHYERRPFRYRLTLPPAGDAVPYRFVWADDLAFEPRDEQVLVRGLLGEIAVPRAALALLSGPLPALPAADLLRALAARTGMPAAMQPRLLAGLRAVVDELMMSGVLRLEPLAERVAEPV